MPKTTTGPQAAYEEHRREEEDSELSLVRKLMDFTRMWCHCERRECRRRQRCCDARTCQDRYSDDILWWKRNVLVPYLRKRYPTVQWGAPASVVEVQFDAALAAEKEAEAAQKSGRRRHE